MDNLAKKVTGESTPQSDEFSWGEAGGGERRALRPRRALAERRKDYSKELFDEESESSQTGTEKRKVKNVKKLTSLHQNHNKKFDMNIFQGVLAKENSDLYISQNTLDIDLSNICEVSKRLNFLGNNFNHCKNVSPLVSNSAVFERNAGGKKSFICVPMFDFNIKPDSSIQEFKRVEHLGHNKRSNITRDLLKRPLIRNVAKSRKTLKKIRLSKAKEPFNFSSASSFSINSEDTQLHNLRSRLSKSCFDFGLYMPEIAKIEITEVNDSMNSRVKVTEVHDSSVHCREVNNDTFNVTMSSDLDNDIERDLEEMSSKNLTVEKSLAYALEEKSLGPYLEENSPEHVIKEKSLAYALEEKSLGPYLEENSPEHVIKEKSLAHALEESGDKSFDYYLKENSPEHVQKEKSLAHVLKEKSLEHSLAKNSSEYVLKEKLLENNLGKRFSDHEPEDKISNHDLDKSSNIVNFKKATNKDGDVNDTDTQDLLNNLPKDYTFKSNNKHAYKKVHSSIKLDNGCECDRISQKGSLCGIDMKSGSNKDFESILDVQLESYQMFKGILNASLSSHSGSEDLINITVDSFQDSTTLDVSPAKGQTDKLNIVHYKDEDAESRRSKDGPLMPSSDHVSVVNMSTQNCDQFYHKDKSKITNSTNKLLKPEDSFQNNKENVLIYEYYSNIDSSHDTTIVEEEGRAILHVLDDNNQAIHDQQVSTTPSDDDGSSKSREYSQRSQDIHSSLNLKYDEIKFNCKIPILKVNVVDSTRKLLPFATSSVDLDKSSTIVTRVKDVTKFRTKEQVTKQDSLLDNIQQKESLTNRYNLRKIRNNAIINNISSMSPSQLSPSARPAKGSSFFIISSPDKCIVCEDYRSCHSSCDTKASNKSGKSVFKERNKSCHKILSEDYGHNNVSLLNSLQKYPESYNTVDSKCSSKSVDNLPSFIKEKSIKGQIINKSHKSNENVYKKYNLRGKESTKECSRGYYNNDNLIKPSSAQFSSFRLNKHNAKEIVVEHEENSKYFQVKSKDTVTCEGALSTIIRPVSGSGISSNISLNHKSRSNKVTEVLTRKYNLRSKSQCIPESNRFVSQQNDPVVQLINYSYISSRDSKDSGSTSDSCIYTTLNKSPTIIPYPHSSSSIETKSLLDYATNDHIAQMINISIPLSKQSLSQKVDNLHCRQDSLLSSNCFCSSNIPYPHSTNIVKDDIKSCFFINKDNSASKICAESSQFGNLEIISSVLQSTKTSLKAHNLESNCLPRAIIGEKTLDLNTEASYKGISNGSVTCKSLENAKEKLNTHKDEDYNKSVLHHSPKISDRSYLESTRIRYDDNHLNISLSPIANRSGKSFREKINDKKSFELPSVIVNETEYEDSEAEGNVCSSPSLVKEKPTFNEMFSKMKNNSVINEESEQSEGSSNNTSSVDSQIHIPRATSQSSLEEAGSYSKEKISDNVDKSIVECIEEGDVEGSQEIREDSYCFKQGSVSECSKNSTENHAKISTLTVEQNLAEESSFHEGFTTILKDINKNALTRSAIISKVKQQLSFINPTDRRCTQDGITRDQNKRTRAQTSGIFDRIIYKYCPKQKANVISHRELIVSPRTIRRRQGIKSVTSNVGLMKHRKKDSSLLRQIAKPEYMNLNNYTKSSDGVSVFFTNPETYIREVRKVILSVQDVRLMYSHFEEKKCYFMRPKFFSKQLLNSESETLLEIISCGNKVTNLMVVIDECMIYMKSSQRLIVPRDVWFILHNPNNVKITVSQKISPTKKS